MPGTIIIFFCRGGKECVRNKSSYRVAHHIFPPSFKVCISIIPRYMSWVFSNILSWRGHRIAKLVAEYRAEELLCVVVPYVSKEVAHGMVCLSESRRGLSFRDVICVRRYRGLQQGLIYCRNRISVNKAGIFRSSFAHLPNATSRPMDYFEFFNVYYVYDLHLIVYKFKAIRWNVTRLHSFRRFI